MALNNYKLDGNFAAVRIGIIQSIPASCVGFFYPRTDGISGGVITDLSSRAIGATLQGSPTISAGYMSVAAPASGQFAQTTLIDAGGDMTILYAGRTSDTLATTGTSPYFVTNLGADTSSGVTGNRGASIICGVSTPTAAAIQGDDFYNNAGAAGVIRSTLTINPATTFRLYAYVIATTGGVTSRTFYDLTANPTPAAGSVTSARLANTQIAWKFGGPLSTAVGGMADTAHISFYNAALSSAQLTGTTGIVSAIRANLAAKGITV